MDFITNLYNQILAFIRNILEFFGLDTSKMPGFLEEETTASAE